MAFGAPAFGPVGAPSSSGFDGGAFTTPTLAPNGSNSLPAYAFSNDADSGMYRAGANSLGFATNAAQRMQIDSNNITGLIAFLAPNASEANPSYSFSNSADAGLYRVGTNRIGIAVGGVTQCEFNASGVSLSMSTAANSSGMTARQLLLVFQASGISLMYSSGKTSYVLAQSSQSVVQA